MFSVSGPKQKKKRDDRCQFVTSSSLSPSLLNFPRQREKRREGWERRMGGRWGGWEGAGGGCRGERQGPEVCLGGRRLSVAVNRGLFDAIVSAQACLSPGVAAIKDADSRRRRLRRAGSARANSARWLIYTWHINFGENLGL